MARRVNKKLIVGLTIGAMVLTAGAAVVMVKQLPETDPELLAERARQFIEQGDVLSGAKQLARATHVSKDPKYLVEAGEVLNDEGRIADARELWQQALVLDPAFLSAHEKLTKQALDLARRAPLRVEAWRRVLNAAGRLLNISENNPRGLHARGMARLRLVSEDPANKQQGEDDLVAAVAGEPDHPDFTRDLANYYVSTDRTDKAEDAFEALLQASPDDPDTLLYYANYLLREKRADDALARLEQAKQVAPKNVGVHIALGKFWNYQKDQEKSEQAFRTAIETDPDGYDAYLSLGAVFMRTNEAARALEVFKLRLDRGPLDRSGGRAWESRYYHATLLEQAIRALLAMASNPGDNKEAADARIDEAEGYLNERVAERGEDSTTHMYRGSLAMMRGQDTTAVKEFEMALQPPAVPHPLVGTSLATLYIRQNQLGKAERLLSEVVNQFPLRAEASAATLGTWTELANVQIQLGRSEDAIRTANRILEHVPDHRPAIVRKAQALQLQVKNTSDPATRELLEAEMASLFRPAGTTAEEDPEFSIAADILEGRLDHAEATLHKLLKDRPDALALLRQLLTIYERTDRRDEAVKLVAEAEARNPENLTIKKWQLALTPDQSDAERSARILEILEGIEDPVVRAASLADHARRLGNLDEARQHLDAAEALQPDSSSLLVRQFMLAIQQQAWDRAEKYTGRLGKLNVDGAAGRTYRGQLHLARAEMATQTKDKAEMIRRLELAVAELRQALDEYPSNSMAQSFLGMAYRGLGRRDEARTEFEEAIRLNPNNGLAQKQLAQMAYQIGDNQLGDIHLAQARRTLGQDPWVQAKAAELAERSDPTAGIERREALRKKKPDDLENLMSLARLYNLVKQHEQAVEIMTEARKIQPDNTRVVLVLANLLGESGQLDQGVAVLTEWIATQGDNQAKARGQLHLANYYRRSQHAFSQEVRLEQAEKAYEEAVRLAGENASVSLALARWKRAIRAFDDAITWYDKAATQTDDAAQQARFQLEVTEMIFRQRRLDDAAARAETFRKNFPNDLRGDLIAGVIDLDRGRTSQALAAFDKVIVNDRSNASAYYRRADLRFRQNLWTECIADLRQAKNLSPDGFNYQPRILLARALDMSNRHDEAVAELDEIRRAHPEASQVVAALVNLYSRQERWSEAEALLVEYTTRFPSVAEWAFRRGQLARQQNNRSEALIWLEKAAELSGFAPVVTDAYLGALLSAGRWDDVIRFATTTLPEDLRDAGPIQRRMAFAQARKGNLDAAWTLIDRFLSEFITLGNLELVAGDLRTIHGTARAIELVGARHQAQPDLPWVTVLHTMLVGAAGNDPTAGIGRIETLLADAKDDNVKLLMRQVIGTLWFGRKEYDKAREAYEAALKIQPEDIMSLNNIAYMLAEELKQPREALPYAERGVQVSPQDANALDTLAWVHFRVGELDKAVSGLQQAIQLDNRLVAAHYHLGMVYEKRGDRAEAVRALRNAIKAAGDGSDTGFAADAKTALRRLGERP